MCFDWTAAAGFNVVRLQWSNEMVAINPLVDEMYIAANPQMKGLWWLLMIFLGRDGA